MALEVTRILRRPFIPSPADDAHDRLENIVQAEQNGAEGQHERGGDQDKDEECTVEDEPNGTANVLPSVVVKMRMMKCGLHALS